ncbi:type VI secretion lipoprotein TssJ [Serratia sp. UGAL515B_01]|uniref:type VI secretion lipoprotein TssJ n=1 Tax=Serratia sp. UGAL515B_01 TaxID=2986763 RepID=UPI002952AFE8|nr:type VI secretion lipoprotein TssJ [Serratia sp. UGAL515B_01]WON77464.1 type VI secretion lipoprotein TssJ [Serratia sp. UGAL515B_01]
MRNLLRVSRLPILVGWALFSGCSWFSSTPETPPLVRKIDLRLIASQHINPGGNSQGQPVKICVIETDLDGWSPPGLYRGTPCSDIHTSDKVLSVSQYMLAPSETLQYAREVPFDQDRWLVIAAEFQNMGQGQNLIQLKSSARTDFNPVVRVEGSTLTLLISTTSDVSKEE